MVKKAVLILLLLWVPSAHALKHHYDSVTDQFGNGVAGATITVTEQNATCGSGAAATIYTDDGVTPTAVTGVVTADAYGRYDFYVADGNYDITITGSGITTLQQCNVEISEAGGAATSDAFVTIGHPSDLSGERALTGTASEVTITDGGANSTATISLDSTVAQTDVSKDWTTNQNFYSHNGVIYADRQSGSDAGDKLTNAISVASAGQMVNACGLTGAQAAASTIVVNKAIGITFCGITLTSSATGSAFDITASGAAIFGVPGETVFITSDATADIIKIENTYFAASGLTFRSSTTRTAGAGLNQTSSHGSFDHLQFERTFYGILIGTPGAGYDSFSDLNFLDGNSSAGNWEAAIWIGAGTSYWPDSTDGPTIASNHFTNVKVTGDSAFTDSALHIDGGVDTLLFTNLEICNGACVGSADSDGIRFENNAVGGPAPDNARWVFCNNCLVEAGVTKDAITVSAAHDIKFTNWYVASSNIGINTNASTAKDISFINGTAVSIQSSCIVLQGGSDLHIDGNHISECSRSADGTYSSVSVLAGLTDFTIRNNDFTDTFVGVVNHPYYNVQVNAGAGDRYEITGNHFANYVTGDLFDGGTGTNKIVGPNFPGTTTAGNFDLTQDGKLRWNGDASMYWLGSNVIGTDSRIQIDGGSTYLSLPGKTSASTGIFSSYVSGDTQNRIQIDADGTFHWGTGSAALDTTLARSGAGVLALGGSSTPILILGAGTNQSQFDPSGINFEGATDDGNETRLSVTDPTVDRTFNIPDADSTAIQPQTCTGTDKVSGVDSNGVITCDTDATSAGGGLGDPGGNGVVVRTALDTTINRTITGTSNEISVANGDGVSGNPTLSLPATVDLSGKTAFLPPAAAGSAPTADGDCRFDTTAHRVVCGDGTTTQTYSTNDDLLDPSNLAGATPFVFDGATADANKTTLAVTDPTGSNTFTIPDADSVAVQPDIGASNNFLTGISTAGVVSKAQPAFSNLSGTATTSQLPTASLVRPCEIVIGDPGSASSALADDNDTPAVCGNVFGATLTITEVKCMADTSTGSPAVLPIITGGASNSILSSAIACGNGTFGSAGTLNGTPTETSGQSIDANISTAGGTAKYIVIRIVMTLT